KTILVFGLYLCVLGFILLVTPNTLLGVLGLPLTTEGWIRILGGLVGIAGGYYIQAARHELIPFFRATIWGRLPFVVLLVVFSADPFAIRLTSRTWRVICRSAFLHWLVVTKMLGPLRPAHGQILGRARYAEDRLDEAIKRGISQYVILGAGLDSFAFRRPDVA